MLVSGMLVSMTTDWCGIYHGFMPIVIEASELDDYLGWLDTMAG